MSANPSASPTIAERLTAKRLRDLVKLHRDGVTGADTALRYVLTHQRHDLDHVLESSDRMIALVYNDPDPVRALVDLHDSVARLRAHRRKGPPNTVTSLWHEARFESFGVVRLPYWRLHNLTKTWKKGLIQFDDRGYLAVGLVKRLLDVTCTKRCFIRHLEVASHTVRVYYTTRGKSCGHVSLNLQHPTPRELRNVAIHHISFSPPGQSEPENLVTEKQTFNVIGTVTYNIEIDIEASSAKEARELAYERRADDWIRNGDELVVTQVFLGNKQIWDEADDEEEPTNDPEPRLQDEGGES